MGKIVALTLSIIALSTILVAAAIFVGVAVRLARRVWSKRGQPGG